MLAITMATDGACSGNPGPGGWGTVLTMPRADGTLYTKTLCGGEAATTNNRMELTAAIQGFRALLHPATVEVLADSQYLVNAFNNGWLNKWQANHWRNSKRESVENRDLWESLLQVIEPHTITWTWVKGHAGHPLNEQADALARTGMSRVKVEVDHQAPQGPSPLPFGTPSQVLGVPEGLVAIAEFFHERPDLWQTFLASSPGLALAATARD